MLESEGHDVMTVAEQQLSGVSDGQLYNVCRDEARVLITLDRDFELTLRFPPELTAGIVVLDCRGRLSPGMIASRIAEFAALVRVRPIDRELWIVEPGRVRIHERREKI